MAAVLDTYRLITYCAQGDQVGLNVSHRFVSSVTGAGASDLQIATAFSNLVSTNLKLLINAKAAFKGVSVQKIWPLPLGLLAFSTANAAQGEGGATALPRQVAGFFNMKTIYGGRNQIARVYVPFPAEEDNDDTTDRPTTGYMTRLGALAANYLALLTAGSGGDTVNLQPTVWHRETHTSDQLYTVTAKQLWATQRRRGDFGRQNVSPI